MWQPLEQLCPEQNQPILPSLLIQLLALHTPEEFFDIIERAPRVRLVPRCGTIYFINIFIGLDIPESISEAFRGPFSNQEPT